MSRPGDLTIPGLATAREGHREGGREPRAGAAEEHVSPPVEGKPRSTVRPRPTLGNGAPPADPGAPRRGLPPYEDVSHLLSHDLDRSAG